MMDIVKKYKLSTVLVDATPLWSDLIQECSQDGCGKEVRTVYVTCHAQSLTRSHTEMQSAWVVWPDIIQKMSQGGYSKTIKTIYFTCARPNSDQISYKTAVTVDIVKKYKLCTLPAPAPQFWPDIIQKCSQDGYSKTVKTIYFTCARAPILTRYVQKMQSGWI